MIMQKILSVRNRWDSSHEFNVAINGVDMFKHRLEVLYVYRTKRTPVSTSRTRNVKLMKEG